MNYVPGESGFFDLPEPIFCRHEGHSPPTHLYIPPGKGYRHVCPGCGRAITLYGSRVTCGSAT